MKDFDKKYFEKNQEYLLSIANSKYLKWVLGLNRLHESLKDISIDKITPSSIHWKTGKYYVKDGKLQEEWKGAFFTRPRFSESLAYNLSPFAYLMSKPNKMRWQFSPVGVLGMLALILLTKGTGFAFMGTTTSYFSAGGDGSIDYDSAISFADARGQATGNNFLTTGSSETTTVNGPFFWTGAGQFQIARAFFPFDTSGISGGTVTAADFNIWSTQYNATASNIAMVASTQASNAALVRGDFGSVGSTEYATRKSTADWGDAGSMPSWSLNATGVAAVSPSSVTKIALRQAGDIDNSVPGVPCGLNGTRWSGFTGTSNDPFLSVTYSTGFSINVSDSTTASESITMRVTSFINKSDSITITESRTLTYVYAISVVDSTAITESVTVTNTNLGPISVSDATTITESRTMILYPDMQFGITKMRSNENDWPLGMDD